MGCVSILEDIMERLSDHLDHREGVIRKIVYSNPKLLFKPDAAQQDISRLENVVEKWKSFVTQELEKLYDPQMRSPIALQNARQELGKVQWKLRKSEEFIETLQRLLAERNQRVRDLQKQLEDAEDALRRLQCDGTSLCD